jgi:large repetitive protein
MPSAIPTAELSEEMRNLGAALGLVDGDHVNLDWFSHAKLHLESILSDHTQREGFLNLLDQLVAPDPDASTDPDTKWHPLLGAQPHGNLYLTIRTQGADTIIGVGGRVTSGTTSTAPSAALQAHLPLIMASGDTLQFVAGQSGDGPLDLELSVQVGWHYHTHGIGLHAAHLRARLTDNAGTLGGTFEVRLEQLDLDGSGPHDVTLRPDQLEGEAIHLAIGLLQRILTELASTATGELAALAQHLLPLLGFAPDLPTLPLTELASGPAVLQQWFRQLCDASGGPPAITRWLVHLAGLFGISAPSVTGSGTESDPWRVSVITSGTNVHVDVTLAQGAQPGSNAPRLLAGLAVVLKPSGTPPPARVEARGTLLAIPLSGTAHTAVLPHVGVYLIAPGDDSAPPLATTPITVGALHAGAEWDGSAIMPVFELREVTFPGTPASSYHTIDLTNAGSAQAAATTLVVSLLGQALGTGGPGHALTMLLGLDAPLNTTGWTRRVDVTQLVANPARAVAAYHRGVLLDSTTPWSAILGELARLLSLNPTIQGTGTPTDPWRVVLEAQGALEISLCAWNAQTSGVATDPQQLRLGLGAMVDASPWSCWWLAELLAFDLPASEAGHVLLLGGQHVMARVQPIPVANLASTVSLGAAALSASLDWTPGAAASCTARLENLWLIGSGSQVNLGTITFPPPAMLTASDLVASLGISMADMESAIGLLLAGGMANWNGMPGYALAGLLGLNPHLPGFPGDWPPLADPLSPGSLVTDPEAALRAYLARLATQVSAIGTPFLPQALSWLRAFFSGMLPSVPGLALPQVRVPVSGSGLYEDPWALPLNEDDTQPADLLVWLEPAGPPLTWAAGIADSCDRVERFEELFAIAQGLAPFQRDVREAISWLDTDLLTDGLVGLASYLATSDGVVPADAQVPTGASWTAGTAVAAAHHQLPAAPSAITQTLDQIDGWQASDRAVLFLGPAFTGADAWTNMLNAAETRHTGTTSSSATFSLRQPGVDPLTIRLATVPDTVGYFVAELQDDGTATMASRVAQIGAVVDHIRSLKHEMPVILVAHSTAGIAARQYVAANASNVRGLITLGTPHAGASLAPLTDNAQSEALRLIQRLCQSNMSGTVRAALDHLQVALDGYVPGATGMLPTRAPYPLAEFVADTSADTGGVAALAIPAHLDQPLLDAMRSGMKAIAQTVAAGTPPATPTHLAFGVRTALPLPGPATPGDVAVDCSIRAGLHHLCLGPVSTTPPAPHPEHGISVRATLTRARGWLAGHASAYAGSGMGETRARWLELGLDLAPDHPGHLAGQPFAAIHQGAFHGPTGAVSRLGDADVGALLGAAFQAIAPAMPPDGTPLKVLYNALSMNALGMLTADSHGGFGISADALNAVQVDALGYLASRFQAALNAGIMPGFVPDTTGGGWALSMGSLPLQLTMAASPWRAGIRTTGQGLPLGRSGSSTGLGAALTMAASLDVAHWTATSDWAFSMGNVQLGWSQSTQRVTLAIPGWLDTFTLVPTPSGADVTAAVVHIVPRLLLSSAAAGLLGALVGPSITVGPLHQLLTSPGTTMQGPSAMGTSGGSGGSAFDPNKINQLLSLIGQAINAPPGTGLTLPGHLRLSAAAASGGDGVTLRLDTTTPIGSMLSLGLTTTIDSLRHVTPGGTLGLALPLGTWGSTTVTFGVGSSGVTLVVTPSGGARPITILPAFSGLGALAAGATALLPAALDALINSYGTSRPRLVTLALDVASSLDLYDITSTAPSFASKADNWRRLTQGDWHSIIPSPAAAVTALYQLFGDTASPLHVAPFDQISLASSTSLTWSLPLTSLGIGSGTVQAAFGWDSHGPMLSLGATDVRLGSGPVAVTLNAEGHATGDFAFDHSVDLHLDTIGLSVVPQLHMRYNAPHFECRFLPLGAGQPTEYIALAPTPALNLSTDGAVHLAEQWIVPLVARALLTAVGSSLSHPLWTNGPTLGQVLHDTGFSTSDTSIALPSAIPTDIVAIAGDFVFSAVSHTTAKVPVGTLQLGFSNDSGNLGVQLSGHQDFTVGDYAVSVRFEDPDDTSSGVSLDVLNKSGSTYTFAPSLRVGGQHAGGIGVGLAGAGDAPLINTSGFRMEDVRAYVFFDLDFTGSVSGQHFGVAAELQGISLPLGAATGGHTGGNNPVAASMMQSNGGSGHGDAHAVNPGVDVEISWRHDTFALKIGGADTVFWLGVHSAFGPIYIDQIGIGINPAEVQTPGVALLIDGGVHVSSLQVQVYELGVAIPLKHLLSPEQWSLDLQGLAASYKTTDVSIAGGLIKNATGAVVEYDGMLLVDAAGYSLTVVGAYSHPDDYTSLFLFVALSIVLGGPPFLFITGLGGGAGYNRELLVPTGIEDVPQFFLVSAIDDDSLANDPMGALQLMIARVPAKRGSLWIAAGLRFTSFALVHSVAVLYVALDRGVEIGVLGVSRMVLPDSSAALISIELALKARFSSEEGILSIQAQLTSNSWLFSHDCQLTGGFAFFVWFRKAQFVLTLGGYHPAFQKPAEFPSVPRLGFRWMIGDYITIKGEAYFALTNSCVMAGGRLEASASLSVVRAWFICYADFLISWDPFYYNIGIGVSIGVEFSFEICFIGCVDVDITLSISASLTIEGPPLHGTATLDLSIASVTVSFGTDGNPQEQFIGWADFKGKYLAPGGQDTGIVESHVTKGMLLPEPAGAQPLPGTADQPWRIGSEFAFTTGTRMPANQYADLGGTAFNNLPDVAELGIQPMRLQSIASTHSAQIKQANGGATDASRVHVEHIVSQVPEGTWNYVPRDQRTASARTLPAVTGLQLIGNPDIRGASAAIPIAKLVDDSEPAKPLPFPPQFDFGIIIHYGQYAEALAASVVGAGSEAALRGAMRVLTGNGAFAAARQATGFPMDGLPPLAAQTLRLGRSSPPLLTPITTGLSLRPVGLARPPVIARRPDLGAVMLEAPRLRSVLQARLRPTVATVPATRTTASRVGANLPRRAPPQLQAIAGARLFHLADAKAPRPTVLAQAAHVARSAELGAAASGAQIAAMREAASAFVGDGVQVPSGTSHVWDLPAGDNRVVEARGDVLLRLTALNGAGLVLTDQTLYAAQGTQFLVPAGAASLAVTCLGRAPSAEQARQRGQAHEPAAAFAAPARTAEPEVSGWQHGNIFPQVADGTILVRGGFVHLAAAHHAEVRRQVASQSMAPIEAVMRGQPGAETWLPVTTQVVLVLLDHPDAAHASAADYVVTADGWQEASEPIVLSYPGLRAMLFDVSTRAGGARRIGVTVAVRAGWTMAGVVGLPGRAAEWATRLRDAIPPGIVSDRPATPDGTAQVRYHMARKGGEPR